MSVEITRLNDCPLKDQSKPLKVVEMGNVIELQYMSRRNCKATIRMLEGGEQYIELSSGEIKDIVHHENRAEQYKSLYRTFKDLRALINTNVVDVTRAKWITLTYAENMMDTKRLYNDFKKFNQRFQYHINKMGFNKAEYIVMMEPQGRGAWHCHLLYIFDCKAPFISNSVMEELWRHGFTVTKKLDCVDNVGAYLTAYLGDIDMQEALQGNLLSLDEACSCTIKAIDEIVDGEKKNTKYYLKGARLKFYPPKFNMYRSSRGVKRPIEYFMDHESAEKKVSAGTLTFEKSVLVKDTDSEFESLINTRQYNMVRKPVQ